ncbi:hypothetical protein D3C72_2211100 [compost metagenome]
MQAVPEKQEQRAEKERHDWQEISSHGLAIERGWGRCANRFLKRHRLGQGYYRSLNGHRYLRENLLEGKSVAVVTRAETGVPG